MSKKNKNVAEDPKPKQLNLAGLLPEGFEESDFAATGGLRPIVGPELLMEAPVVGWIVSRIEMPPREDGSKWDAFIVQLTGPCKAISDGDVIDMAKGDEVIIPISGALKNNREMTMAAMSPTQVFLGIFSVLGQKDVGRPSPMWVFDCRLHKKTIPRVGTFALHNRADENAPTLNGASPKALKGKDEGNASKDVDF